MNEEDWCELTETFRPQEHMDDLLKLLGPVRVFSTDDDRVYVFTNQEEVLQHVTYRFGRRWICPCTNPRPCPAVAIMQVASHSWTIEPEPEE